MYIIGVFAGYNMQRGNIGFGGELDYTITPIELATFSGSLDNMIDAKARVGYAFGNALVYGVVGYSFVSLVKNGSDAPYPALVLARNVSGDFSPPNVNTAFSNQLISTVKLRAGISF